MMGSDPLPALSLALPTARPWVTFLRECQRLLIGAVADPDALEADAERGCCHMHCMRSRDQGRARDISHGLSTQGRRIDAALCFATSARPDRYRATAAAVRCTA